MDEIDRYLDALPDGPVFLNDLVERFGLEATQIWRDRVVSNVGVGPFLVAPRSISATRGALVLRLDRSDRDPHWHDILETTRGSELYREALRIASAQ